MDRELQRLVNAAGRLGAAIRPVRNDDGAVTIIALDGQTLAGAVTRTEFSSVEGNRVHYFLGDSARGREDVVLGSRDVGELTIALDRMAMAADRKAKLSRGQIPGALSGKEAVAFMMRFGR
jgi:hypothetical protein